MPHGGSTVLVPRLLERLADEDAVLILTEAAATLPPDGTLLLVEQIRPTDPDDIDATLQHLRLACLFGSGLRSQDELSALAVRAGLRVRRCDDIGWDHRLWVLEHSAGQ
ncbi:methyltransferase [Streptomyces microflavus]|uniref:methyltransferase n=1 Tax=Streptomyces microflavus TaxID=1919 RepID=UPI0033AC4FA7